MPDPDERDTIFHFLTLVKGHGTPVESWLNRTRIQGYDDLVDIALDLDLLKEELAVTFSHEGSPVALSPPQRARIKAYFRALDVEGVDSALPSLALTYSHLKSAMQQGNPSASMSSPDSTSPSEKSFSSSLKKTVLDYTILEKDDQFIL